MYSGTISFRRALIMGAASALAAKSAPAHHGKALESDGQPRCCKLPRATIAYIVPILFCWPAPGRVRIYGKGHNQPADGSGKGVFNKVQNSLGVIILALLYLTKSNKSLSPVMIYSANERCASPNIWTSFLSLHSDVSNSSISETKQFSLKYDTIDSHCGRGSLILPFKFMSTSLSISSLNTISQRSRHNSKTA